MPAASSVPAGTTLTPPVARVFLSFASRAADAHRRARRRVRRADLLGDRRGVGRRRYAADADPAASLLSVTRNAALFAQLGTTFGGNGTTMFAPPDLNGRTGIGTGQGPA